MIQVKRIWVFMLILFLVSIGLGVWILIARQSDEIVRKDALKTHEPIYSAVPIISESPLVSPSETQTAVVKYAEPVTEFVQRITKKPYGIYIDPTTSPVQPERFSGYHNAVDVEYQDVTEDVPVYVIADGIIVFSDVVSGYGGVFMLEFEIDSIKHNALYGHIRPSSLPKVGDVYKKGDQIAVLGTGYTNETDGERRHLHFAILSDNRIDVRGYVQSEGELSGWIDPINLYK